MREAAAPVSGVNRLAAARAGAGAAGDAHVGQGAAHVVQQVFRLGGVGNLDVGGFNQNGHFSASFGVFKRMAVPYAKPAYANAGSAPGTTEPEGSMKSNFN
jgi:hypothetical protein